MALDWRRPVIYVAVEDLHLTPRLENPSQSALTFPRRNFSQIRVGFRDGTALPGQACVYRCNCREWR
jgi:hypothetical protein